MFETAHTLFTNQTKKSDVELTDLTKANLEFAKKRRSIRFFSKENVPKQAIENILMTASTAPSGANKQPWTFVAISDQSLKQQIREAAEAEEKLNYNGRMNQAWIKDLEIFGTNWEKEFLTDAPWLIVIFRKPFDFAQNNEKHQNYYVAESVGIAAGFLIKTIHDAGLVTLTHTPSPMQFLENILKRPSNEKAFLLLPVGYASENASVPSLPKKNAEEVIVWK